jgi:hypothetical protein
VSCLRTALSCGILAIYHTPPMPYCLITTLCSISHQQHRDTPLCLGENQPLLTFVSSIMLLRFQMKCSEIPGLKCVYRSSSVSVTKVFLSPNVYTEKIHYMPDILMLLCHDHAFTQSIERCVHFQTLLPNTVKKQ